MTAPQKRIDQKLLQMLQLMESIRTAARALGRKHEPLMERSRHRARALNLARAFHAGKPYPETLRRPTTTKYRYFPRLLAHDINHWLALAAGWAGPTERMTERIDNWLFEGLFVQILEPKGWVRAGAGSAKLTFNDERG